MWIRIAPTIRYFFPFFNPEKNRAVQRTCSNVACNLTNPNPIPQLSMYTSCLKTTKSNPYSCTMAPIRIYLENIGAPFHDLLEDRSEKASRDYEIIGTSTSN